MRRPLGFIAILVLLAIVSWVALLGVIRKQREDVVREVRAMNIALAGARSFHIHYEGPGETAYVPKLTRDTWVVCPDFKFVQSRKGSNELEELVEYRTYSYMQFTDGWHRLSQIPKTSPIVRECTAGTQDNVFSLPLGMGEMAAARDIELSDPRTILSSTCRDVKVKGNERDSFYRAKSQSLCIDIATHLPTEIRFKAPDQYIESLMVFDGWNQQSSPQFPDGFDPENLPK